MTGDCLQDYKFVRRRISDKPKRDTDGSQNWFDSINSAVAESKLKHFGVARKNQAQIV